MMAFIRYSTLRLAMLLVIGGIVYLVGLRGVALAVVAFLASGIVSLFVLDGQRDAMGESISGFLKSVNARIDADSRKEDLD